MDAYFANATIRFDVQREDVLTKWDAHKRIPNIKKQCYTGNPELFRKI
ncbi:hypothetical protein OL548_01355 [Lysinibacillus sp. MHQ-1]|nr:hypothetical protein OL548_01355 [Lysinibacillus sp. MHQ-1]